MTQERVATRRVLDLAAKRVTDEWGRVYLELGARFQKALFAEAVLCLAAQQDASIPDHVVRQLVEDGWTRLVDMEP